MRSWTIALLLGVVLFHQQASLPSSTSLLLLLAASLGLLQWRRLILVRLLIALILGFLWAGWHAHTLLSQQLLPQQEGEEITLSGWVASLPVKDDRRVRFVFEVERADVPNPSTFPRHLSLSWYNHEESLLPGDHCHLVVRLKRPWGGLNPGGFDYEQWLFREGLRATGYVRSGGIEQHSWRYPLQRLRTHLYNQLSEQLEGREGAGILLALVLGERQGIDQTQWQIFAATGTTHLVAVSGLHISLVAGLLFFLSRWLWSRCSRCVIRWPAPRVAALTAFGGALCYAAMAGFGVPVQRALVMVALALGAVGLRPGLVTSHTLAVALLAIVVIDPLAVLSAGFWLSFGSVALLIYAMQRRLSTRSPWWRWGRVHWVASVGLLPLLVLFFQQIPLIAPLANLVAVPWVGVLVVPLALIGGIITPFLPTIGAKILLLADWLLSLLWALLAWLAKLQPALPFSVAEEWTLLLAAFALVWLLAPRGWPMRWIGAIYLLPILLIPPQRPALGEVCFTLLDVGQGLSAVVETQEHTLLFDTGLRFSGGGDSASRVILPYLRHQGRSRIDTLIVSHGDSDHIGGMATLLAMGGVERLLTSVPDKVPPGVAFERCTAGTTWQWDGVIFEMIHPQQFVGRGNDDSCVVRVRSQGVSLLLTGDIEAEAERELLRRTPEALHVDLLVAPHHGSKTSSTSPFIDAVAPRWVLFPTGYRNRYRFPVSSVVERYRQAGVAIYQTANSGAIRLYPGPNGEPALEEYRKVAKRYWHSEPLH